MSAARPCTHFWIRCSPLGHTPLLRNFNTVTAPLHALTSFNASFEWTAQADQAFLKLKNCFITAPVLILPDQDRQFILEVDASDVDVGAVLSRRSPVDSKLHPCAFLSCKWSLQKETLRNWKLLAVKVAPEEWRHWYERAEQPFLVWTDDKNP